MNTRREKQSDISLLCNPVTPTCAKFGSYIHPSHQSSPVSYAGVPPSNNFRAGPPTTPVRAALQPLKLEIVIAAPCSSTPNEPASTQSKSSDDTDGGGVAGGGGGWCWRLIFTLDSPSSPLDCRVYLPTQLASAEDRQTDNERRGVGARQEGWKVARRRRH